MRSFRQTLDYGIDLGTTNSAIAHQVGLKTEILDGPGGRLVPSVVHVDSQGGALVGWPAIASRASDPSNVSGEFKRLMGTAEEVYFPAAGRSFTPVELSAEVLKALLARTGRPAGDPVTAAVVTIPAMFQLPQCEATQQAARLAGIRFAPLLQEPIAAAIASVGHADLRDGYWLVYDFGGGTFDVTLVRSRGGRLQVLDHDGDNHLGGKDFDRLLTRRAAEAVRQNGRLPDFSRSNHAYEESFERLRVEAERVRIALSTGESERFEVRDLRAATSLGTDLVDFEITRDELESLIRPSVKRTVQICRKMLDRNRLKPADLKRLVLVGGPTLTPCLPLQLEAELGVDARHYVDPITAVAIGAAIYASTQQVPAEFRTAPAVHPPEGALSLEVSYESMTIDPRPVLAGQIKGNRASGDWVVRIQSTDGSFDSGWLSVLKEGAFASRLTLTLNSLNRFQLQVQRDGVDVLDLSGEFSIIHGTTIAKPVLSQSVGVALADNSVRWYLRKGVNLPASQKVTHATTVGLRRGQAGTAVFVPLVQGESDFADRNTVIGVIEIRAEALTNDLPVGSEVVVTMTVDEHSSTRTTAHVPLLRQTFDRIVKFGLETRSPDSIRKDFDDQKSRLAELERMASDLEGDAGGDVDTRVQAIEQLLTEGGADERNQADQLLKGLTGMIDGWKVRDQEQQLREKFVASDQQIRALLKPDDEGRRKRYATLRLEFLAAMERADLPLSENRYKAIEALEWSLIREQPTFWKNLFENLCQQLESGPKALEAREPIEKGRAAIRNNDISALSDACIQLIQLLPERGQQQLPNVLISHIN